jgi:hypothetical protein
MEKISWTDYVRDKEVLLRVKEQRNKQVKGRLTGFVIEGKIKGGIEVTGKRGRRSRKLLDDLKENRRYI